MPEYSAISAATAFMAQVKDIGDWKPQQFEICSNCTLQQNA